MRKEFAHLLHTEMSNNPDIYLITGDLGYGLWDKVKNDLGYDKLDFKEYVNWTTLWTKDKYLLDQLKKMYI